MHTEMLIDGHFIGGPCDQSVGKTVARAPYDGAIVGTAAEGGERDVRVAIQAADEAFASWRRSPRHERQRLLRRIAQIVRDRRDELVDLLSREVGKPLTFSRGEVDRLAITFDNAADALATFGLDALPADLDPRGVGYRAFVERFPIGVILGIVPYNWPFNLAAHKLAPAIGTGNTIVIKPSGQAALSTLTLARIIHEAGCPPGVVNAVNVPAKELEKAMGDPRVKMISFTGSPEIGWMLKERFHDRRVSLELGADSSAIICADADLDWALERVIPGGFGYAGQICISIQHLLVADSIYDEFRARLIDATLACPTGDPLDERTVCGPLISNDAADKVQQWIEEAVALGAKVIAGGGRQGAVVHPTLVEDVPPDAKLAGQEVFGPVMTIRRFSGLDEAISRVNASEYGIHAGVFTHDLRTAERMFRELEVGGVVVNDYPTLRFDNMPYGGVKRSGFGREGVRYAMEEMTEPKSLVIRGF